MRLQEFGCFLWCWAVVLVPLLGANRWPIPFVIHAYVTAVAIVLLNSLRTLGSHRWRNNGDEMTFVDQLLDSVNYPRGGIVSELWGPVGSRFHALHHLFPSLPYHAMPRAHRLLMERLPADSPYRLTESPSLFASMHRLWREMRERYRIDGTCGSRQPASDDVDNLVRGHRATSVKIRRIEQGEGLSHLH